MIFSFSVILYYPQFLSTSTRLPTSYIYTVMSQSIKALSQLLCTRTTQLYISSWRNQRILLNGLHTTMAGHCIYALNHQSIEMGRFNKNTMRSTGTPPLAPVPQHHALHPAYRSGHNLYSYCQYVFNLNIH